MYTDSFLIFTKIRYSNSIRLEILLKPGYPICSVLKKKKTEDHNLESKN